MTGKTHPFASFVVTLFVTAVMAVGSAPLLAQGLLPASFGAWTASAPAIQVAGAKVPQIAGDKAAILHEYGITSAERRQYAQGPQSATVTMYRMSDPTAAFGAFTFLRDPAMTPIVAGNAAAYATGAPDRGILVVGNLVIDVSAASQAPAPAPQNASATKDASSPLTRPSDADLTTLAAGLLPRADRRPYPNIADYLPQAGLERGTERYVLGPQALAQVFPVNATTPPDWVGFDKSAEAIVARYHVPGAPKNQEATLVLALYPTQQIAADRYNQLTKWFAVNGDPAHTDSRPLVFGTRSSALVAVLSGLDSQPVASTFLDQIHYASAVMWDEPSHELTDPSIGTMVVGAFMDTGSIMVLAIAAGIGFGGLRLLMKVILPGKVFDSDQRVEILQLGLTSKPIRVGDFYSTPKG